MAEHMGKPTVVHMNDSTGGRAKIRQIDALTGLRAVAALWVMIYHFRNFKEGQHFDFGLADPLILGGHFGVDLFFVLSGFIITHVYAEAFRQSTSPLTSIMDFLIYRVARIYPVHLLTLFGMLGLAAVSSVVGGRSPQHSDLYSYEAVSASMLMVNAWLGTGTPNMPAWSISAEWLAYLLFAPLCFGLHRVRSAPACYGVVALVMLSFFPGPAVDHPIGRVVADFILGMAAYKLVEGLVLPRFTGITSALCLAALTYFDWQSIPLFVLVMAILIATLAQDADYLAKLLSHPVPVYLGEISYSLYMVHWPVRVVLREAFSALPASLHPLIIIAGYSVTTLVVAAVVYHLVEVPGRKLIRRIHSGRKRQVVVSSEPTI